MLIETLEHTHDTSLNYAEVASSGVRLMLLHDGNERGQGKPRLHNQRQEPVVTALKAFFDAY